MTESFLYCFRLQTRPGVPEQVIERAKRTSTQREIVAAYKDVATQLIPDSSGGKGYFVPRNMGSVISSSAMRSQPAWFDREQVLSHRSAFLSLAI